jgi:hypothetical protein
MFDRAASNDADVYKQIGKHLPIVLDVLAFLGCVA